MRLFRTARSSLGGLLVLLLLTAACAGSDSSSSGPTATNAAAPTSAATIAPPSSTSVTSAPFTPVETRPLPADFDDRLEAFLDRPLHTTGTALADDMGASGDTRWVPWLLDMFRFDIADVDAGLGQLTGIEATGDSTTELLTWGTWLIDSGVDAGPGYRDFKSRLYGRVDPDFEEMLASVEDDLTLSRIMYGGVRRGGIPELNDPERASPAEADWMVPEELVLGAVVEGQAVAYPIRIIGHHELINDTVGGIPVSMVFCTLCRTGLLFDRRVDGQVLDFQTSGLLINSNKIMADLQTDTLWHHLQGVGIGGELAGVELEQFPVTTATWGEWLAEHPDSEVPTLPRPIFFPGEPERPPISYDYSPGAAYRFYYSRDELLFPALTVDDVFLPKTEILGLEAQGESLAIEIEALVGAGPTVFIVGDQHFLVVPTTAGARVYDATVAGFAAGELPDGVLASADEGAAQVAPGIALPRVVAEQGFWFAWSANHPETKTWEGAGSR